MDVEGVRAHVGEGEEVYSEVGLGNAGIRVGMGPCPSFEVWRVQAHQSLADCSHELGNPSLARSVLVGPA